MNVAAFDRSSALLSLGWAFLWWCFLHPLLKLLKCINSIPNEPCLTNALLLTTFGSTFTALYFMLSFTNKELIGDLSSPLPAGCCCCCGERVLQNCVATKKLSWSIIVCRQLRSSYSCEHRQGVFPIFCGSLRCPKRFYFLYFKHVCLIFFSCRYFFHD